MARDRDWVDYANLASNVAQNFQLSSMNDKMRELAALELQKEYREQQEAAVAHREDILREAVFFYTEQLRDVEDVADKNPLQAYIRANHLKGTYERMPQFSSGGFRKFEDKERLANVLRTCDRLIRDCAARLRPDELDKADRCVAHLSERDDLLRLIEAQRKREGLGIDRQSVQKRLAAKEDELRDVHAQQTRNRCPLWVGVWVSLVLGLYVLGVSVAGGETVSVHGLVLISLTFVVMSVSAVSLAFAFSRSRYARLKAELAERHKAIEHELGLLREDARQVEAVADECQPLYEQFGEADVKGYRELLAERDELLVQVAGDAAKSFVQRQEPRKRM
jgi:hypothetical protein